MKYEIRSLKGYRSGVQCIWEKEILVREQLFHHAYGVRQLPDKWSLYKQDFLELVQERIVHIWHITNLTVTTAEGVESGLAKNFFWQKTFAEIWERQKQNIWTEVLLKRLSPTASGSKI